jgi:PAS domain S-box-containing protein
MDQQTLQKLFQEHFFDVLDQIANGIVITEPYNNNEIIYVNETFTKIFEYTLDECIGKNCRFLQQEDTEQQNLQLLRDAINNKTHIQTVVRNYTKSGKLIYNELKISPIFDKDRENLKFFIGLQTNLAEKNLNKNSFLHRVTTNFSPNDLDTLLQELKVFQSEILSQNQELIKRDQYLEALNNEYTSLFHDAPVAYVVVDKQLHVKRYNKLANKYFNFSSHKQIPTLYSLVKELNKKRLLTWIDNNHYDNTHLEIDIKCFNQTINRFELSGKNYLLNKNLILLSFNNIQESYEIKTQLEQRVQEEVAQRLEQEKFILNQAKLASMGEMIDAVAHQWLNPLSSIKIYAQATKMKINKKSKSYPDIIKNQENIDSQINHLVETLKEFRSFFRPDDNLETVNILDIINSCLLLMRDELKKYKIKVFVNKDNTFEIKAIKNQFKHVFINLLTNSRDAFDQNNIKNREIRFEFDSDEENYILNYYDTAGGIQKDILGKIFEPNFTTKHKKNGTGVGLYLCKQILDKFDVIIDAYNVRNGVCFQIKYSKNLDSIMHNNHKEIDCGI